MLKNLIYLLVFIFFTACSFHDSSSNKINEIIKNDKTKVINTFSNCSNDTFVSITNSKKYGKLFIENIDLNFQCKWNGLARVYFEDLFVDSLNLQNIKVIERVDYKNYEFTTYLINDEYYLNLIYKYMSLKDVFILDYEGKLSTELLQEFNQSFSNDYTKKSRFNRHYNKSMVNQNIIYNYFEKERGLFFKY